MPLSLGDFAVNFTLDDYHEIKQKQEFPDQLALFGCNPDEQELLKEAFLDLGHLMKIFTIRGIVLVKMLKYSDFMVDQGQAPGGIDADVDAAAQKFGFTDIKSAGKAERDERNQKAVTGNDQRQVVATVASVAGFPGAVTLARNVLPAVLKAPHVAALVGSGAGPIAASVTLVLQVVYHTYRYWNNQITWQQLVKYTCVNAGAGVAAVGGAIAGAMAGAAVGSIAFGIGTVIGGLVGAILGSLVLGVVAQIGGTWLANKFVDEEENSREAEKTKQFDEALRIFGMTKRGYEELTRGLLEERKRNLYKKYHPDKYSESTKDEARQAFLSVSAAYYILLEEKGWANYPPIPDAPLVLT